MVVLFFIVISIATLFYGSLIIGYYIGWLRIKKFDTADISSQLSVCVIIPVRNEEKNIANCLHHILIQDYPEESTSIIIVNDYSADKTAQEVRTVITDFPLREIELIDVKSKVPGKSHKKEAIQMAIESCSADLIITTDADCWMGKKWISSIVSYFEQFKPTMLVSPVVLCDNNGLFQKMQAIEFNSLIASTAGAIGINVPIMANGANLAFYREAFKESGGYGHSIDFASGDDVFLLHNFKRAFGKSSIRFLKNRDAIVYSKAVNSLKNFYNQRIRWTSKSKAYQNKSIIIAAVIVYLMNFSLFLGVIIACFNLTVLYVTLIAFVLKLIIDLPILVSYTLFANQKRLLKYILILLPCYFIYITIIGALGNFVPFKWERK